MKYKLWLYHNLGVDKWRKRDPYTWSFVFYSPCLRFHAMVFLVAAGLVEPRYLSFSLAKSKRGVHWIRGWQNKFFEQNAHDESGLIFLLA